MFLHFQTQAVLTCLQDKLKTSIQLLKNNRTKLAFSEIIEGPVCQLCQGSMPYAKPQLVEQEEAMVLPQLCKREQTHSKRRSTMCHLCTVQCHFFLLSYVVR